MQLAQKAFRRAVRPFRLATIQAWRRAHNALEVVGLDREAGPEVVRRSFGGDPPRSATAVVLCVWRRPRRLADTVALIEQQVDVPAVLHVWNNNRRAVDEVDAILEAASIPATVTHSTRNVGGFGRFYLARALAPTHPFVVFVDDDVTFPPTMARDSAAEWSRGSISSFWAFRLLSSNDFQQRARGRPGEQVDYCGTGGMVVDTGIFLEPALFRCPRRYWFIEDLWLSYYASHILGWELRQSAIDFQLADEDGYDQYKHLRRRKSRFLRQLVRDGWSVPAPSAGTGVARDLA
jgi:hypothetical protein